MKLSMHYQQHLRSLSISHLKWLYAVKMARGKTTEAAYIALAISRRCGAYIAQRIIGPQIRLVVLLRIVWLDTSRTREHAICCLRHQAQ